MATVDKNFKVKHGLIVEGNTATVNGEDILTTGSTVTTDFVSEGSNLYFTEQRAIDAVSSGVSNAVTTAINALTTDDVEEGSNNLYFTNQRALDATSSAYDAAGSASSAQSAAQSYADGLASNYDAAGAAVNAESNANSYTDTAIGGLDTDAIEEGSENLYFTNDRTVTAIGDRVWGGIKSAYNPSTMYTGVAIDRTVVDTWYDAAGAAGTAESNANGYTDTALESYTLTEDLDATVGGYGYIKSADLSGYATETYVTNAVSQAVDGLVDGAPGLLDTLNEIAAAINDDENYATTMTTALAGKQATLTAGSNIVIANNTIRVDTLYSTDISDFDTAALSATASAYDAAGAASTAEQNAIDYADETFVTLADLPGQLDDYVPASEKGQALGVATLDASGYVPASQLNIDVSGDITTAIDALTTDDIEEGSTNLYFTDTRAVDALEAVVPNFTDVDVNSVARQVAATATIGAGATDDFAVAYSWANNSYKSAKFLVKVIATSTGESEMSEVLVSVDPSDNVHITEYGILSTDGPLATVGGMRMGGSVFLTVSPTYNSTVKVFGTLLP